MDAQTHKKLCYQCGIAAEKWVKYVPLDGFFGIQILQNYISAGAPPQPRWGTYDAPPDILVGGREYLLPISRPLDAFGVSLFGVEKTVPLAPRNGHYTRGGSPKPNYWSRSWFGYSNLQNTEESFNEYAYVHNCWRPSRHL